MKNIKVNYTDMKGKRTSTTINRNIVEKLIYKEEPNWSKEALKIKDSREAMKEVDKKLVSFAQKFTNALGDHFKKIELKGLTRGKDTIEENMLDRLCGLELFSLDQ